MGFPVSSRLSSSSSLSLFPSEMLQPLHLRRSPAGPAPGAPSLSCPGDSSPASCKCAFSHCVLKSSDSPAPCADRNCPLLGATINIIYQRCRRARSYRDRARSAERAGAGLAQARRGPRVAAQARRDAVCLLPALVAAPPPALPARSEWNPRRPRRHCKTLDQ